MMSKKEFIPDDEYMTTLDEPVLSLNESFNPSDINTLNEAEVPFTLNSKEMFGSAGTFDLKKAAQKRVSDENERIAKEAEEKRKAELKEKNKDLFAIIDSNESAKDILEKIFDEYVPASGKSDIVAGELARAYTRISSRWYNDGDVLFIGYGIETCGRPFNYIAYTLDSDVFSIVDNFSKEMSNNCYTADEVYEYADEHYEDVLGAIANAIVTWMRNNPDACLWETDDMLDKKYSDNSDLEELEPKFSLEVSSSNFDHEIFDWVYEYGDIVGYDMRDLIRDFSDDAEWWDSMSGAEKDYEYADVIGYLVPVASYNDAVKDTLSWFDYKLSELKNEYGETPGGDEEEEEDMDESLTNKNESLSKQEENEIIDELTRMIQNGKTSCEAWDIDTKNLVMSYLRRLGYKFEVSGNDRAGRNSYHIEWWKDNKKNESLDKGGVETYGYVHAGGYPYTMDELNGLEFSRNGNDYFVQYDYPYDHDGVGYIQVYTKNTNGIGKKVYEVSDRYLNSFYQAIEEIFNRIDSDARIQRNTRVVRNESIDESVSKKYYAVVNTDEDKYIGQVCLSEEEADQIANEHDSASVFRMIPVSTNESLRESRISNPDTYEKVQQIAFDILEKTYEADFNGAIDKFDEYKSLASKVRLESVNKKNGSAVNEAKNTSDDEPKPGTQNDSDFEGESSPIEKLKKGDYFTVKNIQYPRESQVYVFDGYSREEKKYCAYKFTDINKERYFKKGTVVYTGMTF